MSAARDTIQEALREYLGDGDGADEVVLNDFIQEVQAEGADAVRKVQAAIERCNDMILMADTYRDNYVSANQIEALLEELT